MSSSDESSLKPSLSWGDALLFIQEQKKEIEKLEEKVSGLQAQLEKDSIAFTGIIREKDKIIEGQDKSLWDLVQALASIATNTCCDKCQEASLWAKSALAKYKPVVEK